jgi:hypothetical protein
MKYNIMEIKKNIGKNTFCITQKSTNLKKSIFFWKEITNSFIEIKIILSFEE